MGVADLPIIPILLFFVCVVALAVVLLVMGNLLNPRRPGRVKRMPYESGMDPLHDTRRRFDVRFYLLAIAFLVFDVEILFLYPWAVTAWPARLAAGASAEASSAPSPAGDVAAVLQRSEAGRQLVANRHLVFAGVVTFIVLLALGFIYDCARASSGGDRRYQDPARRHTSSVEPDVTTRELPENVQITILDKLVSWCRKNSLWPMPYATACCGIELMATGASRNDIARFGAEVFRFSPRQCDLMIVAGRVAMKMMPVLQRIWQQMHEPKWCISMGACARPAACSTRTR